MARLRKLTIKVTESASRALMRARVTLIRASSWHLRSYRGESRCKSHLSIQVWVTGSLRNRVSHQKTSSIISTTNCKTWTRSQKCQRLTLTQGIAWYRKTLVTKESLITSKIQSLMPLVCCLHRAHLAAIWWIERSPIHSVLTGA